MLLDQTMEVFTFLLVLLVLQRGLRLDGRVGEALEITKLEPQGAVHIILQRRLRKKSDRTSVHDRKL